VATQATQGQALLAFLDIQEQDRLVFLATLVHLAFRATQAYLASLVILVFQDSLATQAYQAILDTLAQ
jgi:hypothetical protein